MNELITQTETPLKYTCDSGTQLKVPPIQRPTRMARFRPQSSVPATQTPTQIAMALLTILMIGSIKTIITLIMILTGKVD